MIPLHPRTDGEHSCPHCHVRLAVQGWYIPGMRNLADFKCRQCGREFYGDLPSGHGLYYPMLLERPSGLVHDRNGVGWFSEWLKVSYANRTTSPLEFTVEEFRPPRKRAILLNCLDALYGHALLKLLNAQYYLDCRPEFDLIVLLPRFLRSFVPDGVAAVWTVDLPLRRGNEWNDWLAAELHKRIGGLDECWLSIALPHPHHQNFCIERFTRVAPFRLEEWEERLESKPTVTFLWRDDRIWCDGSDEVHRRGLKERIATRVRAKVQGLFWRLRFWDDPVPMNEAFPLDQKSGVITLAWTLRQDFPRLDFGVVGLGQPGGMPDWIVDLRAPRVDASAERMWCERYAESHVVVGVHGSNMLLASALAGSVVELVPTDRWGNLIQDILLRQEDVRESLFRFRFLPLEASARSIADVTASLLRDLPFALLKFHESSCNHQVMETNPWNIVRKHWDIVRRLDSIKRSSVS